MVEKRKNGKRLLKDSFISIEDPTTRVVPHEEKRLKSKQLISQARKEFQDPEDIARIKEAYLHNAGLGYSITVNCWLCGVSTGWIKKTRKLDKDFAEAEVKSREKIDGMVVEALLKRALGFYKPVKKPMLVHDGDGMSHIELVQYDEYFPPELQAIKFWLANRRPHEWSLSQTINIGRDQAAQMSDDQLFEAVYKVISDQKPKLEEADEDED